MSPRDTEKRLGIIKRLWRWFWTPTGVISLGSLLLLGFFSGIIFWGGFHTAMEMTNKEEFCVSCHEMRDNLFAEYQDTIHYSNASGVRASCPDCHVPREWAPKVIRKIYATRELYHHFITRSIWTRERFEEKRMELAQNVWYAMKTTDSRECRNCHKFDYMDFTLQQTRANKSHEEGFAQGMTCIDCHRGIAHEMPAGGFDVDLDELVRTREAGLASPVSSARAAD